MFAKLWQKTKEAASKYTKIFITVMILNQLLFFGFCLNPICLVAAMPHVLAITLAIGLFWDKISGLDKDSPLKEPSNASDIRGLIEKELSKSPDMHMPPIGNVPEESMEVLMGLAHYNYLINSISQSKERLIIMSGWLSKYVIDDVFLKLISSKLNQGIAIYIGYGFQDHQGNHNEFGGSKDALKSLKGLILKFPNQLFVANFATHEKLLVVDDKIVVIGSANWLSNRRYTNSERSFIITNKEVAKVEAKRAIELVERNRIAVEITESKSTLDTVVFGTNRKRSSKVDVKIAKPRHRHRGYSPEDELSPRDKDLLLKLKTLRAKIAKEKSVPFYVIFSDAALMDMTRKRPTTREQMLKTSGVGHVKFDRYGAYFIDIIRGTMPQV